MNNELLRRIVRKISYFFSYSAVLQGKENMYFNTLAKILPEDSTFYPFGGGANSSLLYFISRFSKEFSGVRILELGMGQTTQILNLFADSQELHIAYDDNKYWVEEVRKKLEHPEKVDLRYAQLELIEYEELTANIYSNLDTDMANIDFDIIIVDGPKGTKKNSRAGVLPTLIDKCIKQENIVIIFDDTHRNPELTTFYKLINKLKSKQVWSDQFRIKFLHASKSQACLIKGNKYINSYYY